MPRKKQVFDQPCEADAVDGAVEVDGPNEIAIALTPEAAEESATRLEDEAMKARGQRRMKELAQKPRS